MSLALCQSSRDVWDGPIAESVGVDRSDSETLIGASKELLELARRSSVYLTEILKAATFQEETIKERFERHVQNWRRDTEFVSSVHEQAMHESYLSIIGLGEKALPLILQQLAKDGGHWYWALRSIAQVDPVPEADRGHVAKMKEAWMRWGRANGHLSE